jgi:aspartate/methionine/tyrosine aminotransferase
LPRFPDSTQKLSRIKGAVFEKFRAKMRDYGPDLVRFHIGDSYLTPVYPLPLSLSFLNEYQRFSKYGNTFGIEEIRDVLSIKLKEDNQLTVRPDNILMTTGATNALSIAVHSLLEPGEEILMLTPCWPIFPGIIHSAQAIPVEVPFYMDLYKNPNLDIKNHVEKFISKKTVAIYLNTPNNPSGKVLNKHQLQQIAEIAKLHHLWVISDEAYDGLTFDGRDHVSIASIPNMFPQCITVFTFSKIFMFAGLRLGYAVATKDMIKNLNKLLVHQIYSPTILTQQMMIQPVKTRKQWREKVRTHYQGLRDQFIKQSGLSLIKPEATYFIFFPIKEYLKGRDYDTVVTSCFENGVSVAPGIDFGKDFGMYLRICFTGESPDRLEKGIERLRNVLLNT